ncbi:MAG TPA: four helix bundle protein [Bacteroidales bacterium]|nr:four helix bundle protein [Bacteroidales bacterium]HQL69963.1 four helix bundle protein [Bacteroidales bacterium]
MKNNDNFPLLKMSLNYALGVIDFSGELEEAQKKVIAKKLLEAGFAISSNLYQAKKADRPADYVHNIRVAQKYTDETLYWLKQCLKSDNYPKDPELVMMGQMLLQQIDEILNNYRDNSRKDT